MVARVSSTKLTPVPDTTVQPPKSYPVTAVASIYEGHEQSVQLQHAVEQQKINARAAADQKRAEADKRMINISSAKLTQEAASPFADSSGSFAAVSEGNIEQFSEDRNVMNLNLSNQMKSLNMQETNAKRAEIFGDVSSVFNAASSYYGHVQRTKMASNKQKSWEDIWS